jgi:pyridoxine kinase
VRPELLAEMFEALAANGWLGEIDAVFTGYLPSVEHVDCAARIVARLRGQKPDLLYCCDPILGDEPHGLYLAEDAANALRASLLPLADVITPNRFELGWLTHSRVHDRGEAIAAAQALDCMVLATSSPDEDQTMLANLLVRGRDVWRAVVRRRGAVPHGTGDMMAALFMAYLLRGRPPVEALSLATGGIEAVIEASVGSHELRLIASQDAWAAPEAWAVTTVMGVAP